MGGKLTFEKVECLSPADQFWMRCCRETFLHLDSCFPFSGCCVTGFHRHPSWSCAKPLAAQYITRLVQAIIKLLGCPVSHSCTSILASNVFPFSPMKFPSAFLSSLPTLVISSVYIPGSFPSLVASPYPAPPSLSWQGQLLSRVLVILQTLTGLTKTHLCLLLPTWLWVDCGLSSSRFPHL